MDIGSVLNNRYTLTALLGKGAMGQVYRATDAPTGQEVAIKVVARDLAFDPEILKRFQREGETLRQLRHRSIVGLVDIFQHENQQVIVMEYVAGGSLLQWIKAGPLSLERAREIALDLCDALTAAHRLNIIHRDIKPENVLLAEDGTPKLTDFGVAKLLSEGTRLTGTGTQVGTPYYMAPEAWEGKPLDAQADIWSLGVVLFEMLTGEVPFGGETLVAVMNKVLNAPLPDVRALRPDVPPELLKILRRMLTREKGKRYETVRQVGTDLESLKLTAAPAAVERAPETLAARGGATLPSARRSASVPAVMVAVLSLLGLAVIGWLAWGNMNTAQQLAATQTALAVVLRATATLSPGTQSPASIIVPSSRPTLTPFSNPTTPSVGGKLAVGIVLPAEDYPTWLQADTRSQFQAMFTTALKAAGYDAEILFSQGDPAKEKANVEALIAKGIKVLILCPQNFGGGGAAAEAAHAAGVKVIAFDGQIRDTAAVDYWTTFDGLAVGAQQAQYLVDHATGKGNNLYLYAGAATDNLNALVFFEGAWGVLQPKIADGTFIIKNSSEAVALRDKPRLTRDEESKILGQITTNWDANFAKSLAIANLKAGQAADKGNVFILAPNDGSARAIADAFAADKDVKTYYLAGQDAEKASIQYILDGKQSMTILKDMRTEAKDAVAAAIALLEGKTPMSKGFSNNGKIDVPVIRSAVVTVDRDNVRQTIIDSGYWPASAFTGLP